MQGRILAIETDITRWQQKQNANNNFTAAVPYDLEQLRTEAKEFLDDLSTRDQRMMFGTVTLVHVADTLEQLDADTETLTVRRPQAPVQFAPLRYHRRTGEHRPALRPAPNPGHAYPNH
jgi:precorrin-6B methylase 2